LRIGLVGLDSSHADHFVRDLNVEQAFGPARIVALSAPDGGRAQGLARAGGVALVVREPAAMLGHVDAVIVGDRDGRLHLPHALPFLQAGLPVLVDKPFAACLGDAITMIEVAARHGAPITSFSPLRWADGLASIRSTAGEWGARHALLATGPADAESPWGGLRFYAVHMVEAVLEVAHGPIGEVAVFADDGLVVATTTVGSSRVVFTFLRPGEGGGIPYQLQLVGPDRIVGGELTLSDRYLRPGLAAFIRMATLGELPLSHDDLLAPVTILDRIEELIGRGVAAAL
jgi:Oxidoreductase family, NAD-binding Rossmann fold